MRITRRQLRNLIREELSRAIYEADSPPSALLAAAKEAYQEEVDPKDFEETDAGWEYRGDADPGRNWILDGETWTSAGSS